MQRFSRNTDVLVGLVIFTLVVVVNPCRAQIWDKTLWDNYISYSQPYSTSTYGRTASLPTNYAGGALYGATVVVQGILTTWVTLDDVEDSAGIYAASYTLQGVTWEWTGAPGTAPAATLYHSSAVEGEVWAVGETRDDNIYPYPSLSVEAEAEGTAFVDSDEGSTEAGGYATGWVDGPRDQATAYVGLTGYGSSDPHQTTAINGYFEYDVSYERYLNEQYETASGLSEISGVVGIILSTSSSGSASDAGENAPYVHGEAGISHEESSATLQLN